MEKGIGIHICILVASSDRFRVRLTRRYLVWPGRMNEGNENKKIGGLHYTCLGYGMGWNGMLGMGWDGMGWRMVSCV